MFKIELEAALTIPKFTAEWTVVVFGQELFYVRSRTWKIIGNVRIYKTTYIFNIFYKCPLYPAHLSHIRCPSYPNISKST